MSSPAAPLKIGVFKAWLSVWIGMGMVAGLGFGLAAPEAFELLGGYTVAQVNPVTATLVWLMILPTMVQIDYSNLPTIWRSRHSRLGSLVTLSANWIVAPLTMTLLAVLFLKNIFTPWINEADADQYVAGLVLLGVAPCTGMVFVWSRMTGGDAEFTLSQVSVNDIVLLIAFAPIAGFLLGAGGIEVPWLTLLLSTTVYVVIPLIFGFILRQILLRHSESALSTFDRLTAPLTKMGLILLVILLFGFQAEAVVADPLIILLISVPLIIQAYGLFILAYGAAWWLRLPNTVAAPAALIGTSNFFELAVAIAVAMFGVNSPAVIATVVGVLVEVPIMLTLVAMANRGATAMNARAGISATPA